MTKRVFAIVLTAMMLTAKGQTDALKVKEMKLSNGLTVWVNEDHSQPKVFGAVVVKAGAIDCPDTGLAHYFEHILFKGTDKIGTTDYEKERVWLDSISAKYDLLASTADETRRREIQADINRLSAKAAEYAIPNEFSNLISRYGGSGLNAATGYTYTYFYNTFIPQYIGQWAELNSERLINPVFRLFQSELETVYEEKNMYSDNPVMPAMEHFMGAFFAGTPYAYPIIGSTKNLKNPQLSEMREFYDKYYVAGNMGLILCGDICADSIRPVLERTFGRLRPGTAPARSRFTPSTLTGNPEIKIKVPIPIIKISGFAYRTPGKGHADEPAFDLAVAMLGNESESGLLDSLSNSGTVLAAGAMNEKLNENGATIILTVPKIPFGSKKKAEAACMEQIEKLKRGEFSNERLEMLKQEKAREFKTGMESISKRAETMIEVFGNGQSWDEYVKTHEAVNAVTKADVMDVANRYFGNGFMKLGKSFGSYPKDKVSQPGYKPMTPKNMNVESEYAKVLDSIHTDTVRPRLIDFGRDAVETVLGSKAKLYTVRNPVNDVFNLKITYHKGTTADPLLDAACSYAGMLGVDSLSKHEFGKELQKVGATVETNVDGGTFNIIMTGFDSKFNPSLQLLRRFLTGLKADDKKQKDLVNTMKISDKAFAKDYLTIATAAIKKTAYGEKSEYLSRCTAKETAQLTGEDLVRLFRNVQGTECSVVYSGTLDSKTVEKEIRNVIKTDAINEARKDPYRPLLNYDEPLVYVYNSPGARQTILATYTPLPPATTRRERLCQRLWGNYFGGGMSSVMFQELREMRSLAYYATGAVRGPSFIEHADGRMAFITGMGTQADKAMGALEVLDSLFNDMPVRPKNMENARREMFNSLSTDYPTFREIGSVIASDKLIGYDKDPNTYILDLLPTITEDDIRNYYDRHVKGATRVTIIIGDKKKLDMNKLSRYGKIVELRKQDIYKD